MTYQVIEMETGYIIRRLPDGASIPADVSNRDYRRYLDWIAEGNVAENVPLNPITSQSVTDADRIEALELMVNLLLDTQESA